MTGKSIVVGIDGSPVAEAALLWAARAADVWQLPLLIVLAGDLVDGADLASGSPNPSADLLASAERMVRRAGISCEVCTLLADKEPEPLLEQLSETASLIVVGTGAEGRFTSILFGSVSSHVNAHASCPVITVPPKWIEKPVSDDPQVIVGVKQSSGGAAALEFALSYAQASGARLTALRCWDRSLAQDPADPLAERDVQQRVLDAVVDAAAIRYPFVRVHKQLTPGPVHDALRLAALNADLLVIGTRYESGVRGSRLGPIAARLTHRMPCPVASVSAQGSASADNTAGRDDKHDVRV